MSSPIRNAVSVLRSTWEETSRDNAMMFAAAVTFYAIFSLAPLLVLLIGAGGLVFGEETARANLLDFVSDVAGPRGARAADRLLLAASKTDAGTTALSIVVLIVAASAVFRQLRVALNIVLDVPTPQDGGFWLFLRRRAVAVLIVVVGILLLVAALGATSIIEWIRANVPQLIVGDALVWRSIEVLVSFAVLSAVFAAVLRYVPDMRLRWRHVGVSAPLAALTYAVAQLVISIYVGRSNFGSAYGAAGSVVLLLLYVYVTVAVLLAAAELTEVLARRDAEFQEERRRKQEHGGHKPRK